MSDWRKGLGVKVTYRIGPFGPEALITAPGFACCVGVDYLPTLEEAELAAAYTLRYALLRTEVRPGRNPGPVQPNAQSDRADQAGSTWLTCATTQYPIAGVFGYGRLRTLEPLLNSSKSIPKNFS
jgi:hypothetical protein